VKLLTQIVLVFAEGKSEKIFEIDLCEVGPNQRVVNFRYGKRGGPLKDGSKTIAPVSPREADRVLADLVNAKTEQGYRPLGAGQPAAPPRPAPPAPAQATAATRAPTAPPGAGVGAPPVVPRGTIPDWKQPGAHDLRRAALVERLRMKPGAVRAAWLPKVRARNAERIIWRAGELGLREAEPLLLGLIGGGPLRDYCVAWALGRCGSAASVSTLGKMLTDARSSDALRRIAAEALMRLSDDETRGQFRAHLIGNLPEALRALAHAGPADAFSEALSAHIAPGTDPVLAVIDDLYRIDNEHVRPAVLAFARSASLTVGPFRRLRHLFKMAEYRGDGELFGIIAHRFEKQRATFKGGYGPRGAAASVQGRAAYGSRTREYLRRRVWRTLRRLGELGDPAFVPMAVGALLPFSDDDAVPVRSRAIGRNKTRFFDAFSPYFAFNRLLYRNSSRYTFAGMFARLETPATPNMPQPPEREEAFPACWDAAPGGLLHLLDESACLPVHEFASRALRGNPSFCATLDLDVLKMLLERPYEVTARLGFDLVKARYRPDRPDGALLVALARCAFKPAREQAFAWIDAQRLALLSDTALLAGLVTAPYPDARAFARKLLLASPLGPDGDRALTARIIAATMALKAGDEQIARDVGQVLLGALGRVMRELGDDVVRDLLGHPLPEVRELGAQIVLLRPAVPPDDLVLQMVSDQAEGVRGIGMRIIAQMPDHELLQRYMLLVRLSTHRLADLRLAARSLIRRVAQASPELGALVGKALVDALLRRKLPDDVPAHIAQLLREDLPGALEDLPAETIWKLLRSASPEAQELGGLLLAGNKLAGQLSVAEIATLASHDILAVRQAAWAALERGIEQVRADVGGAVKVLDARWEDSRAFGFRFFRERLRAEDFTPAVLVAICDSVRPDVQSFGREMLTRHFREEDGPELLMRLSEHPAGGLQLYTTSYLDRYAGGRPERISELAPFFTAVLSRPNRGRVGKRRVLTFLRGEGVRDEASARVVVGVLHRLSATCSVEYRALAIEAMVAIHRAHPGVAVPLAFTPPQERAARPPRGPGAPGPGGPAAAATPERH
jgi:hypothetical protein